MAAVHSKNGGVAVGTASVLKDGLAVEKIGFDSRAIAAKVLNRFIII
jgi:translation initiation factor 2B subunit (eIF-2B alpha/beta/delta family)